MLESFEDLLEGTDQPMQLLRFPNGKLVYYYKAYHHGEDTVCMFTLLCEVGEPYRWIYVEKIKELQAAGWRLEQRAVDQRPYLADYLYAPDQPDAIEGYWWSEFELCKVSEPIQKAETDEQKEFRRLCGSVASDRKLVSECW